MQTVQEHRKSESYPRLSADVKQVHMWLF